MCCHEPGTSLSATQVLLNTLLLPCRYSDKEYWDQRYARSNSQFEWFYGSNGVKKVIRHYITKRKPVLHIGCGNSTIQEGLGRRSYTVINVSSQCPQSLRGHLRAKL
jgi:hypothetical protein